MILQLPSKRWNARSCTGLAVAGYAISTSVYYSKKSYAAHSLLPSLNKENNVHTECEAIMLNCHTQMRSSVLTFVTKIIQQVRRQSLPLPSHK